MSDRETVRQCPASTLPPCLTGTEALATLCPGDQIRGYRKNTGGGGPSRNTWKVFALVPATSNDSSPDSSGV